ncbi:FecCD family ABC transporter permease [Rubrimonas sp.]|uniref:FecCD family ABC transporter permease n=1 Tax=Rubrimonas sp. TaxID=2036015 RepID=UPI002FDECD8F
MQRDSSHDVTSRFGDCSNVGPCAARSVPLGLRACSSAAVFGAILAPLNTGIFIGLTKIQQLAIVGAPGSALFVLAVASFAEAITVDRLVLTGFAASFIVMELANVLILLGDPRATYTVAFWMPGGLGLAQSAYLGWPLQVMAGAAIRFRTVAGSLNARTIGDEPAATLAISAAQFRLTALVVAALVTGFMIAYSGVTGFVGLTVPHIVRLIAGGDDARFLPAAMLAGAVFLVRAEIVARAVMRREDMPIGIVTSHVGGAFFVLRLRRNARDAGGASPIAP